MTLAEFRQTLKEGSPPGALGNYLQSLWWDARGDWDKAHDLIQDLEDREGAWIHAYLHRKEGDLGNAGYWYRRAGRNMPSGQSLETEWEELAGFFLARV